MSHEYAMSRVKDALEKSDGNHLKAQRLILSWIEKDQTLLLGLVTPHIQGIITHAVNHADAPAKKKTPPRVNIDESAGEFGAALVRGIKGSGTGFGEAPPKNLSKPGKASQKHVDAINLLAGAGKKKDEGKKK